MKNIPIFLFSILVALMGIRCGNTDGAFNGSGATISGTIQNAAGLQVFLDKATISNTKANHIIGKGEIDMDGNFSINFANGLEAGIYRLRIGAKNAFLVFDGKEKNVIIDGNLTNLQQYQFSVNGSPSSQVYLTTIQGLIKRQINAEQVKTIVDTTANPLVGMLLAVQALPNSTYTGVHNAAKEKVAAAHPNSPYVAEYESFIVSLNQVKSAGNKSAGVQFIAEENRQPAPDIRLPDPKGKEYALSDLKGQVVLLDFWASWCGPCRRENPNVVNIYKKYKDRGFTVFSVSLDGMDSRTKSRFQNDDSKIADYIEQQKGRWVQAIQADKLEWDYHVSDLKKWECAPARQYGVSSIPRTFMIDKNGKIAAQNLRGAEQIEDVLLKLL